MQSRNKYPADVSFIGFGISNILKSQSKSSDPSVLDPLSEWVSSDFEKLKNDLLNYSCCFERKLTASYGHASGILSISKLSGLNAQSIRSFRSCWCVINLLYWLNTSYRNYLILHWQDLQFSPSSWVLGVWGLPALSRLREGSSCGWSSLCTRCCWFYVKEVIL